MEKRSNKENKKKTKKSESEKNVKEKRIISHEKEKQAKTFKLVGKSAS